MFTSSNLSLDQIQKDQESIISDYTERFENMNCYLEEIQTEQIQILEKRISQLLERIEKLELFVTNGTKDTNKKDKLEKNLKKLVEDF
jgi:cob(I)alamin adenosyltransferase|tara:strand:- start:163 stop:426 length:264 start_codon:yes stop_codon:yes gene_type:complete